MPQTQAKFWMVYGIGEGAPRVQHWTKADAEREAERLAIKNPGTTFVVLSAVNAWRTEIAPVEQVKIVKRRPTDFDIPF